MRRTGRFEAAVAAANLPTLLVTLLHLTGDRRWFAPRYRPSPGRGLDDHDDGGLPADVGAEIRRAALSYLHDLSRGRGIPASSPSTDELAELLSLSLGETIGREYGPLIAEELQLAPTPQPRPAPPERERDGFEVLVIGAGFAGLCAAVELQRAGISYTLVERHGSVGGTWHENRYPGCGCDTPSHLYSFSFAPDAGRWSRYYATRDEIQGYLARCAQAHGITERIRFQTEVVGARWDARTQRWSVELRDGAGQHRIEVNAIVSGVGQFNPPRLPSLPGLARFAGRSFHTAHWPSGIDVSGRRFAVVGTGASAMQVVPALAGVADRVTVFQRSPQWVMPNPNYHRHVSASTRVLLEDVPFYAGWYRLRLFWLFGDRLHPSLQVDPDWEGGTRSINATNASVRRFLVGHIEGELASQPDLARRVTPDYPPFGKRMLMDNRWLATLARDDVELVTDPLVGVERDGLATAGGTRHRADVIVFATGFDTLRYLWPMRIEGRSGRTLEETWGERDARAYLGITLPDFPNLFLLYGPNTNPHGGSVVSTLETQVHYVVGLLGQMRRRGIGATECRRDVYEAYNRQVDAAHERMVWTHPAMSNYFRNEHRVVTNSPFRLVDYWHWTHAPTLDDYVTTPAARVLG